MLKYGNKFHNYLLPIKRDGISLGRPLTSPVSEKEKLCSYKLSRKPKLRKHMTILGDWSMTAT